MGWRQSEDGGSRQGHTDWATVHSRLCTAQRAPQLRNHGFVYLNDTFPADSRKVSCFHIGGFQQFSNRPSVLWKGCSFQIYTKVLYGSVVALHRDQEGKGTLSLSLVHAHTPTPQPQSSRDQEKGQKENQRRDRYRERLMGPPHSGLAWEEGVHGGGKRRRRRRRRKKNEVAGRRLHEAGRRLTRGGRTLVDAGQPGWVGEWNDGTIVFFGGADSKGHS